MKTGKIGKFRIRPSSVHRFSRSTDRIKKKLIVRKGSSCLPLLETKRIVCFFSIIGRDMNDLVRYLFGTIFKSFYSALPFCLFMSFAPPSSIFVFSFSPFFVLYMFQTGGGNKCLVGFIVWPFTIHPFRYL